METGITFKAGDVLLDGLLNRASNEYGVVITHPHPQYGGDMNNPVVSSVVRSYRERGFSTLRFNFRGVGGSGGSFDNGIGESYDVLGAIEYLLTCGILNIHLAGYSFGAWVNALITTFPEAVETVVAVSPPVSFLDYSKTGKNPLLKCIISGRRDEFANPDAVEAYRQSSNPEAQLEIFEGCDHFYSGCTQKLETFLSSFLRAVRE